jgi:ATP-dependent Lhr-like helicase
MNYFPPENLLADIQRSVNSTEMAKRKFRDIAVIGGLISQGYPGTKKSRHIQPLLLYYSMYLLNMTRKIYYCVSLIMKCCTANGRRTAARYVAANSTIKDCYHFSERLTPFCFR